MLGSGSQIQIALRLQFRDPDHPALVDADKTRQQVLQLDLLRFHGVAADGDFDARFGELTDAPCDIRIRGSRMKRPQRLAVDDKRYRDVVGTASK